MAGLTTALLLSRRSGFDVTVVAKHMPGDYDIEYTSPWAGANYLPLVIPGFYGLSYSLLGPANSDNEPGFLRKARAPQNGIG